MHTQLSGTASLDAIWSCKALWHQDGSRSQHALSTYDPAYILKVLLSYETLFNVLLIQSVMSHNYFGHISYGKNQSLIFIYKL